MHYIRLLRPPVVEQTRSPPTARLVLTITTDLGDAFLSPKEPIDLCILAASANDEDEKRSTIPINLTQRAPPKWKAGMRVLKLNLPLPRQPITTLQIRPLSRALTALSTLDISVARYGLIMPVYVDLPSPLSSSLSSSPSSSSPSSSSPLSSSSSSTPSTSSTSSSSSPSSSSSASSTTASITATATATKKTITTITTIPTAAAAAETAGAGATVVTIPPPLPTTTTTTTPAASSSRSSSLPPSPLTPGVSAAGPRGNSDIASSHVAFRSIRLAGADDGGSRLQVEEDMGESIARHVWDAGVVAVALLAELCLGDEQASDTVMPRLAGMLRRDAPLNVLELGCGVGVLGVGMAHVLHAYPRRDASALVLMTDLPEAETRARANMARFARAEEPAAVQIEYENLDWEAGREGRFGKRAGSRAWDLVMLSDCIYNSDMLPMLVQTLTAVHAHSSGMASASSRDTSLGTRVFMAQKPRHHSEKLLFDLLAAEGWSIDERMTMPVPVLDGEEQIVEAYLFVRN